MTLDPWRLLGALAGLCLGEGLWWALACSMPEADLELWTMRGSSVPLETAELSGELLPHPARLDLSFYDGASPKGVPFQAGEIELDARVPDGAQLRVRLGAEAGRSGPMAPSRGGGPASPPNGGGPPGPVGPGGPGGPGNPGGPGISGPAPDLPPRADQQRGVSILIDRASGQVRSPDLHCTPAAAPGERFTLTLKANRELVEVFADGQPLTRCVGRWDNGDVVVSSGIRRIQITRMRVAPNGGTPLEEDFSSPMRSWPGRALFWGLGLGAGLLTLRRKPLAIAAAPLLTLPLLALADTRSWLDQLRMLEIHEAFAPLIFAGLPAAMALLAVGAASRSLSRAMALGLVPLLIALPLIANSHGLRAPWGWLILGLLGVPWSALCWVNTHPVARRPAWSYALLALLLVQAELGARGTTLSATWTNTQGWVRAREEFAELLEIRKYSSYPSSGFPVAPPPPNPVRKRIVALGGSSTGGAFQMDSLDLFWPKKLEESLSQAGLNQPWEVVNQGVGGWNSLHVRLYVESQIERLDADIFAIYIGHNDVLTLMPAPYKQLYQQYQVQSGGGLAREVSETLSKSLLYFGFRFAILSLRDSGGALAVPVEDARENLAAIIAAAQSHQARVILMTEGLNPDPLPMAPYGAMQKELAEETGSLYLNAAENLYKSGDPDLFLDDCHLSMTGHEQLASWIRATLLEAGWL